METVLRRRLTMAPNPAAAVARMRRWPRLIVAVALVSLLAATPVAQAATSLGEYRDNFSAIFYGNSLGSLVWAPDWIETNDDGSPWTGKIHIGSGPFCTSILCLTIGRDPGSVDASIQRSADLSAADSATLSFTYRRHDHAAGAGLVRLSVSETGTGGWVALEDFALNTTDPAGVDVTHDLTPWASSATTIRFELIGTADESHMNVDNLSIELLAEDNLAPVLDPIAPRTIAEEVAFSFTATASDPNAGDALTYTLDGAEPAGAAIAADGDFTWTPTEAQGPGVYSFDVIVRDDGGPSLTDSQTVLLTVEEVNAPPTLAPVGNKVVEEGSALTFSASATDPETPARDLVFELYGGAPSGAAMTPSGIFTWTPTEGQGPGSYDLDVKVWDGSNPAAYDHETITVTVTEKNEAPQLVAIPTQSVDEGVELSFVAVATDSDVPTNGFTYRMAGAPSGAAISPSGVFTWTPSDLQGPGTFNFDVVVLDDGVPVRSDTEQVTIVVNEANIAPVINTVNPKTVAEGSVLQFVVTATDPDSPANTFDFSLAGAPSGATITPGGTFSWTPTESQGPGTFTFDIVATDDGVPALSSSVEATVMVKEINTAPVLNPIAPRSINEGAPFKLQIVASDADLPADELIFTLEGAPPGAMISPTGLLTWTPSENQGPATFSFDAVVTDDGSPVLSDTQTVTISVASANNAPVIDPIGTLTVGETELLAFTATATDPDVPANTFWFSLSGNVPGGASITSGGAFTWIPDESHGPGLYKFDVMVTDTGSPSRSSAVSVTVVVEEVNQPPVLVVPAEFTAEAGVPFVLAFNATDDDLPEQSLSYSATGLPGGAVLSDDAELSWVPGEDMAGDSYEVRLSVTDSGSPPMTSTAVFMLIVVTANAAPVLAPIGDRAIQAGEMLRFVAEASDEDGPADALSYALSAEAPAGALIDPSSGVFEWRPTAAQDDTAFTFTVKVTDDGVVPKSDSERITVTVGRPNRPPIVDVPPNQKSTPGASVTLAIMATDPDEYPGELAFAAFNLPPGLEIDGATGRISGKPGFDGLAGSPYRVEVVVSDGRDGTSIEFDWAVTGIASPLPATPTRSAVVAGINEVTTSERPAAEASTHIGRSIVLMARAVRSGVSEMSFPFLLLIVMIAGVVSLGRIGIVPIFRRRTRHDGILVNYDTATGAGLVARIGDGGEVFVHASAITRRDRDNLVPGDSVIFRTVDGAYRDLVTKLRKRR